MTENKYDGMTSHLSHPVVCITCLSFIIFTMHEYYIYIMSSSSKTIYTGITNDLIKRVYEHKNEMVDGFTKKYRIKKLVYFEQANDVVSAIAREKQIKGWNRKWKIHLIEKNNPDWNDLYTELL